MPHFLYPSWPVCLITNGVVLVISFAIMGTVLASAFSGAGAMSATGGRGGFMRMFGTYGLVLIVCGILQVGLLIFDGWSIYEMFHRMIQTGVRNHPYPWNWYLLLLVYILCGLLCLRMPALREQ